MDGVGALVFRSIGSHQLRNLVSFLTLDEFDVQAPARFPDNPRRGFETVTYMLEGEFLHEDFKDHKGRIGPGELQWVPTARYIVHSHRQSCSCKDKTAELNYQVYPSSEITHVSPEDGVQINVIAGEFYGAKSPVMTHTQTIFIDVKLQKGKAIEQVIPKDFADFIYTISGTALFGTDKHKSDAHVLDDNGGTFVPVDSLTDDCHFVVIAGQPIKETIVQHDPFVMSTNRKSTRHPMIMTVE